MGTNKTLKSLRLSTILAVPAMMLLIVQPAYADCSVTSGSGTVSSPTDGDTITCTAAGGTHSSTIGDGTDGISANIIVEENGAVSVSGFPTINVDQLTLIVNNGASVENASANQALYINGGNGIATIDVTLNRDSHISSANSEAVYISSDDNDTLLQTVRLSGDNSYIAGRGSAAITMRGSQSSLSGVSNQTITLSGDNSYVAGTGGSLSASMRLTNVGTNTQTITLSGNDTSINGLELFLNGDSQTNTQTIILSGENSIVDGAFNDITLYANNNLGSTTQNVILSGVNSSVETSDGPNIQVSDGSDVATVEQNIQLSGLGSHIDVQYRGVELDVYDSASARQTVNLTGNNNLINSQNSTAIDYNIARTAVAEQNVNLSGENASISSDSYTLYTTGNNYDSYTQRVELSGNDSALSSQTSNSIYFSTYSGAEANQTIILSGDNTSISSRWDPIYVYKSNVDDVAQNITLSGENASLISTQGQAMYYSIYNADTSLQTVTLSGADSLISGQTNGIYSYSGGVLDAEQTIILSGVNSAITTDTGNAIGHSMADAGGLSANEQNITLSGENSAITASDGRGVYMRAYGLDAYTQNITLSGNGANITVGGATNEAVFLEGGSAQTNITLAENTSIVSANAEAIKLDSDDSTTSGNSTIDSAGLIQGATNSILLDDGDDNLILRTGSQLSSATGVDLGDGNDTLTLIGNATEDERFLNIETVDVYADNTGWDLSANNSFDDLTVHSGRFANNGILTVTNGMTVQNGAQFGGSGVTNTNIVNYGIMTPGNSIGTQTINGNYTQDSTGQMNIEFNSSSIDLLDISGTATLAGKVSFSEYANGGVTFNSPYTFVSANGGISGAFTTVPEFISTSQGLAHTNVDVNPNTTTVTFTKGSGLTAANNTPDAARDILSSLDNASPNDGNGAVAIAEALKQSNSLDDTLESQTNVVETNAIQSSLSTMRQIVSIAKTRINSTYFSGSSATGLSSGDEILSDDKKSAFWIHGVHGFGSIESSVDARGADYDSNGMAVGLETDKKEWLSRIGVLAGYTDTSTDIKGLSDTSHTKTYQLTAYGYKDFDDSKHPWRLSGSLSAAYMDYSTYRPLSTGTAEGHFDGYGTLAELEASYNNSLIDGFNIYPYGRIEGGLIYRDSYREDGAGPFNMDVKSGTTQNFSTEIGLDYRDSKMLGNYIVKPKLKLGWKHQYLDNQASQTAAFVSAPSVVTYNEGPNRARDSMHVKADFSVRHINNQSFLYAGYEGLMNSDAQDHLFTAGVKIKW